METADDGFYGIEWRGLVWARILGVHFEVYSRINLDQHWLAQETYLLYLFSGLRVKLYRLFCYKILSVGFQYKLV